MSANSNNCGRAYEYAWIKALQETLSLTGTTRIKDNSSLHTNERAWNSIDEDMQNLLKLSAKSAVNEILELEPLMTEDNNDELILEFQRDEVGTEGDVRDIIIKRNDIEWEIGLSIKHNHEAIKHSRLSQRLDFGQEWFNTPCSSQYWSAIRPIFERLKIEKKNNKKWSELSDKEDSVYVPLLNAFINEVTHAYSNNSSIPTKMVEYLIGINDYYKIVSHDRKQITFVHTFNIHGTLNKPSRVKVSAFSVPVVSLPTELIALQFKTGSKNTIEMYLNNGWQLSFRIHNASTKVEPSLKFDIQFIGMPTSILTIECRWHNVS